METKEKTSEKNRFDHFCSDMPCYGTQTSRKTMPDCHKGMKACRWFPLVPIMLGIALLLLGYFLNPEITRVLWMVAAGFVSLMGVLCLTMMFKMKKMCTSFE